MYNVVVNLSMDGQEQTALKQERWHDILDGVYNCWWGAQDQRVRTTHLQLLHSCITLLGYPFLVRGQIWDNTPITDVT